MPQVLQREGAEQTLRQLAGEAGVHQQLQYLLAILQMLLQVRAEDDHVVQVHHRTPPCSGRQQLVHRPLERAARVEQTHRHDPELELPLPCLERRLRGILVRHHHLPVPRLQVQAGVHPTVAQEVQRFVHPRNGVRVRPRHSVQPPVVHRETPLAVLLLRQHHTRTPLGSRPSHVHVLPQRLHLPVDLLMLLGCVAMHALAHRRGIPRVDRVRHTLNASDPPTEHRRILCVTTRV